jgi:hypothetical protein
VAGDGELPAAVARVLAPSLPVTPGRDVGSGLGAGTNGQLATHASKQVDTTVASLAKS